MTTRILIVEDTASEMEKAREAAKKFGFDTVCCDPVATAVGEWEETWAGLMDGVDGVATDLFWRHGEPGYQQPWGWDENPNFNPSCPSGLLVVIRAVSKDLPVVVCTDCGDEGHHGKEAGFIHDGYCNRLWLQGNPNRAIPCQHAFGWEDCKNWDRALQCLALTIADRQTKPR